MSSTTASGVGPQAVPDGEDHTIDASTVKAGQLAFLYGYEPVVVFSVEDDGTLEVARFGQLEFHPVTDLSDYRGPRPFTLGPEEALPGDKIAKLEQQVQTLLELVTKLTQGGATTAPPEAPAEPTASAPSGPIAPAPAAPAQESPAPTDEQPAEPAASAPVTPFGTPAG